MDPKYQWDEQIKQFRWSNITQVHRQHMQLAHLQHPTYEYSAKEGLGTAFTDLTRMDIDLLVWSKMTHYKNLFTTTLGQSSLNS